MATILVDNRHICELFSKMIVPDPRQYALTRVLCILARSGKGKSTLVDYLMEYCQEQGVLPIRVDFDAFHISDELELIDTIISQFGIESVSSFPSYSEAVKQIALTARNDTLIENVKLVNTCIGTIYVQKEDYGTKTKLQYLENVFFQDLKKIPQASKCKVVLFLDAYERAGKELQAWIQNKLILSNCLGPHILVVVASQSDFMFPQKIGRTYGIQSCRLPDTYEFEDWIEYGRRRIFRTLESLNRAIDVGMAILSTCVLL